MELFIGTAGFSYKDWNGIVYPNDLKKRKIHPLEYLAEFFDCCEINASFYGHIRPNVGKDWCKKVAGVNPEFQFTAKLFQGFTHLPRGVKALRRSPWQSVRKTIRQRGKDSILWHRKAGSERFWFSSNFIQEPGRHPGLPVWTHPEIQLIPPCPRNQALQLE
jgi:uncharacterized protein YecE (DUF72 family)